jgi:hypothetical protein
MIKSAFLLFFMVELKCLNASVANDLEVSLNAHPTVKFFKGFDSESNLEELKGNPNIVSITFLGQAKSSEISEVLQIAGNMPALKFLRFLDESVSYLNTIPSELFEKVSVFTGSSKPELLWRRVWKLPFVA